MGGEEAKEVCREMDMTGAGTGAGYMNLSASVLCRPLATLSPPLLLSFLLSLSLPRPSSLLVSISLPPDRSRRRRASPHLAAGETVIVLHLPLHLVGLSMFHWGV